MSVHIQRAHKPPPINNIFAKLTKNEITASLQRNYFNREIHFADEHVIFGPVSVEICNKRKASSSGIFENVILI